MNEQKKGKCHNQLVILSRKQRVQIHEKLNITDDAAIGRKTAHSATHTQPTNRSATGQFQLVHDVCFLSLYPTLSVIIRNVIMSLNIYCCFFNYSVHFINILWT